MRPGELAGLVDGAPGDLRALTGALHQWVHPRRSREATERLDAAARDGVFGIITASISVGGPGEDTQVEDTTRVWFEAPNRWCLEGQGAAGERDISDGRQRWQGTHEVVTVGQAPAAVTGIGTLGWMLAPGHLLGTFRFEDLADDEVAGRRCVRATARPRPGLDHHLRFAMGQIGIGPAALDHRFWFDAAHGLVVRHEGTVDGEPSTVTELRGLAVGGPIDPARFRPPAGTEVRTELHERLARLERAGVDPSHLGPEGALRALGRAAGPARLADRTRLHVPLGPPPEDRAGAEAAIARAFEGAAATDPSGRRLVNVQAGQGLAPLLALAARRVPGVAPDELRWALDATRFLGPDQAAVWFSVEVDGRPPVIRERQGRAVRVGDRWLIEHATFADLLSLAGVQVPPPDER